MLGKSMNYLITTDFLTQFFIYRYYINYKEMKKQIKKICKRSKKFLGNDSQTSLADIPSLAFNDGHLNRSPSREL